MSEQTLQIAGMSCAACQHHVERALCSVPGVESASVNLLANSAHINPHNHSRSSRLSKPCVAPATTPLLPFRNTTEPSITRNMSMMPTSLR